jgi:outer membrane protein insertion porin family
MVALATTLAGCAAWQPPRTAYDPSRGQQPSATQSARVVTQQQSAGQPAAARTASQQKAVEQNTGDQQTGDGGSSGTGQPVIRGQEPAWSAAGGYPSPTTNGYGQNQPAVRLAQAPGPNSGYPYMPGGAAPNAYPAPPGNLPAPNAPEPLIVPQPQGGVVQPFNEPYVDIDPRMSTPVDVIVEETQTGRFMFGAGINSDAGVTGQIVIDERNFDITRLPTSFRDFADGTAFRGGGQGFRLEAMPGTEVQRYLVSFTEPYLLNTPISLNLSGFLYDRRFFDWDESRIGGRMALGYRLTPDLSISGAVRAERVEIDDPRILVPELDEVLGDNNLYSGKVSLTHDTRDIPFAPTEGHLFELSYEQVFGDFDYPRAVLDYRKYYLIRERPDGSGRHTLGNMFRLGFSGKSTPIFERFYAGGFSTMRGFEYRGASPSVSGVRVGGDFMFLGSTEYLFPLTADDMLKGALFVDYGTVEQDIELRSENFRVAPGFGVRISIPALGPAPLAFDFAFPVAQAETDDERMFTFFFGMGR